jgi:predicted metal-dependent hydrolase
MPGDYKITIRRQQRTSLMMRLIPGGIEVFIPRWMKKDSPKVRAFIQSGLEKLGGSVPPIPTEQTSRAQIEAMVKTWARRVGVQPGRVQFRAMSRKWGSCSSRDNITLNSRLTWLPAHLAEYVVLHELVHLKIFNHGKDFKAMMHSHMPDWLERERELDQVSFR